MRVKINWFQILLEVVRVVIAGLAGGAGASMM